MCDGGVGVGDDQLGAGVQAGARGTRVRYASPWRPGQGARALPSASWRSRVLDHGLIQRTLATALRTGGDLAEIFVEDRASVQRRARRRQGREPHRRGATGAPGSGSSSATPPASPTRPTCPEAGLAEAAEAAAAAARSGGGGVREVALTRLEAPRPNEVAILPEDVAKAAQGGAAAPGRRRSARAAGVGHHPGDGPLRRQPPAHPRRQQRRPPHRGRPGPHPVLGHGGRLRRHRHADRLPVARAHRRLRAVRHATTWRTSAGRPPSGRCSSWPPVPRPRARCRS